MGYGHTSETFSTEGASPVDMSAIEIGGNSLIAESFSTIAVKGAPESYGEGFEVAGGGFLDKMIKSASTAATNAAVKAAGNVGKNVGTQATNAAAGAAVGAVLGVFKQ